MAGRYLGLDLGERRIGFAFGNWMDMGSSLVVPGGFLSVYGEPDAVAQIKELAEDEEADGIVIGLPLLKDAETDQSRKVRSLAEKLRQAMPGMEIHFWNESHSSQAAERLLIQAELKHSGKRHRGRVDATAAALILQGFLDARRFYPGM